MRAAASSVVDDSRNIFTVGTQALKFPERLMDVNMLVSSPDNRVANDATIAGKYVLSGSSVKTVWTGKPQRHKDADWAPIIDLDDVKAVGRATGTTVNDVMLSAVSIALTRYLNENGDDTTDELIWMVPVSIQPVEPGVPKELGNHFALVTLRMPIGIHDFVDCVSAMHERMERIKSSDEGARDVRASARHCECAWSAGRRFDELLREQGGWGAHECPWPACTNDPRWDAGRRDPRMGALLGRPADDDLHLQLRRQR